MHYWRNQLNFVKYLLFGLVALLVASSAIASDDGKITGTVIDAETGDAIIGVSVYLEGTSQGAVTDIDGTYTIKKVVPGTYSLRVQAVNYATVRMTDVDVVSGDKAEVNFKMSTMILELDEIIVVTGQKMQRTEAFMLKHRQASESVSDAISADEISRSGSSDAAEAVKTVVGASVVDGKHVYVRGLGDRYSNTQLNGAALPSPDPDKQSAPLDLIPSNLLDNIVVQKSFTPDKPGNFAGGSVNLSTRDYPGERTLKFSTSASYNSVTTFENDLLAHDPSSKDWLAYDNGKRDVPGVVADLDPDLQDRIPQNRRFVVVRPGEGDYYAPVLDYMDESAKSFNPEMRAKTREAPLNQSHSLAYGDQWNLFDRPLGIVSTLSYSRKLQKYNGFQGRYRRGGTQSSALTPDYEFDDVRGKDEVHWGGLVNLHYGVHPNHKFGVSYMHNQHGQSTSRYLYGQWLEYSDADVNVRNYVLHYTERHLDNLQFSGQHAIGGNKLRVEWQASLSSTSQYEPDLRFFTDEVVPVYLEDDDTGDLVKTDSVSYVIQTSRYRAPQRLWRDLNEDRNDFTADFTYQLNQRAKLKAGGAYAKMNRSVTERRFLYQNTTGYKAFNGNIDAYAADMGLDSMYTYYSGPNPDDSTTVYLYSNYLSESTNERDQYHGEQKVSAAYGMIETPLLGDLTFIGGLRHEHTDMSSQTDDQNYDKGELKEDDLLPSINFVHRTTDRMNLRLSLAKTLARPTLREMTPSASEEFAIGSFFNGNADLKMTRITNFDLRWEWFVKPGEIIAVSGFYKKFKDPIELAIVTVNRDIKPLNSEDATVMGLEFEFRRRLDWISSHLASFKLGGNLTLVRSRVDIAQEELDEILPLFPDADRERQMAGQSPYIVNLDLEYDHPSSGTSISAYYNVFGERFAFNSEGMTPDVYEQPFSRLDLRLSQKFIAGTTLNAGISNLLDSKIEYLYEDKIGDSVADEVYESYSPGRTFSLGVNYNVW